jgi:TonB family protein
MMPTILEWTLRSSTLVMAIWLALKILRVRSPQLERSAWRAVLLSSLAMPVLMELLVLPAPTAPALAWLQNVQAVSLSSQGPSTLWHSAPLWFVTFIAALLFIRHLLGIVRWWSVRRVAKPLSSPEFSGIDIRIAPEVSSPATVFSTVLVPADFHTWTPEAQRLVVAHEQTHVQHKDFYVQWLAHLHRCLFWFNPLAWWLANRLSLLSEHISDDAAIEAASERAPYAKMLLNFAQRTGRHDQLVAMARGNALTSRIERILAEVKPKQAPRWKTWLFGGALLSVVGIVAGFQSVAARSGDPLKQLSSATLGSDALDPVESAALEGRVVLPKSSPQKPLSHPVYPPASRRLNEHGTVVLKLLVLEDGSVGDAVIDESTGYPDLDYAAFYEAFRWQLEPGTVDGLPSRMWGRFAVTFKLDRE